MAPRAMPQMRAPSSADAYSNGATAHALQPQAAPQPVMPPPVAQPAAQAAPQPAPQAPKGPSLFQRMTGAARREPAAPQATYPAASMPAAPQAPAPAPAAQPAPAAPSAPAAEARPEPKMRPTQPKLGGLDPTERLQTARAEEDMLDIPAFLRRQAN
jgi:cell division protein FtsZ